MEERRRGEEEHVPPGGHRLSKVRGLGRFGERAGTGCTRGGGGERVEPLPSSLLSHDSSARRHRVADEHTVTQFA